MCHLAFERERNIWMGYASLREAEEATAYMLYRQGK